MESPSEIMGTHLLAVDRDSAFEAAQQINARRDSVGGDDVDSRWRHVCRFLRFEQTKNISEIQSKREF
jgi:hypothetical protein